MGPAAAAAQRIAGFAAAAAESSAAAAAALDWHFESHHWQQSVVVDVFSLKVLCDYEDDLVEVLAESNVVPDVLWKICTTAELLFDRAKSV